jgi:hypothetical protein
MLDFKKPAQPRVLGPDIEAMVMPAADDEMQMAASIKPGALLEARVADFFILQNRETKFMQLKSPEGKPFLDLRTDAGVKRFFVFALPAPDGNYHDDPAYMAALQCKVKKEGENVWSIMPEKIFRGRDVYFVMAVSYPCCASPGGRARTLLYSDTSESKGPFLNRAFTRSAMRPEIKKEWDALQVIVVDGMGGQALRHLAKDLTGQCKNHAALADPAKSGHWKGQTLRL